tara:strand:+ start:1820 stop:2053 length:234 start_codon:yes stop_codon:yes gene_type:complete
MKLFKTDTFDGLIETLLTRFESNPYSLTQSELEILKWFSKNHKPLEKLNKEEIFKMMRIDCAANFVKKKINENVKKQ